MSSMPPHVVQRPSGPRWTRVVPRHLSNSLWFVPATYVVLALALSMSLREQAYAS